MIVVPVLSYHGIDTRSQGTAGSHLFVSPDRFRQQVESLARRGYKSMPMFKLAECLRDGAAAPGKSIVLTFDDGFRNNYDHVLPLLTRYGWVGVFYLVVRQVGGIGNWSPKVTIPLLTWQDIQEMHRAGMEIGSHTLSHPRLTRQRKEDRQKEIADSRKILEDKLGAPVRSFCYPFGDFNEEIEQEVQEAGYTSACTVLRGNLHCYRNRFRIKRITIYQQISPLRLAYRTSIFYNLEHVIISWLSFRHLFVKRVKHFFSGT